MPDSTPDPFAFRRTEAGNLAAEMLSDRADEGPVLMLNLLRFKPDGGEQIYQEYVQATAPLGEHFGVKIVLAATAAEALIGNDYWDQVLVVQYPTRQTLIDMLNTELYAVNVEIRARALEDSELHAMDSMIPLE
jgi:uncharacterized protein (DUF1330 family)